MSKMANRRIGEQSDKEQVNEFVKMFVDKEHNEEKSMDITRILCAVAAAERRSLHEEEWEEKLRFEALYEEMEFTDDAHGGWLPKAEMIEARRLEKGFFRKMGVYRKIPKAQAKGKTIISTRWVDTNKGTEAEPVYRSRLVAKEIKRDIRLDLFSATPPLEVIKTLLSMAAKGQKEGKRIGIGDVKRAYFYAPTRREIYIRIPKEDTCRGMKTRSAY